MARIVGDREARPYDAMIDVGGRGLYAMARIVGEYEIRPYDAMIDVDSIGLLLTLHPGSAFATSVWLFQPKIVATHSR
jgi:hypothetical protein